MISSASGPYEHRHLVSILAQALDHRLRDNETPLCDILFRNCEVEFEGTEESKHQSFEPMEIVFMISSQQEDKRAETHSTRLKR